MSMEFKKGDLVEVGLKEEGLLGSYYTARIVQPWPCREAYFVEYLTLLKDYNEEEEESKSSEMLREVVKATDVRPIPPPTPIDFRLMQEVDAFDRDGWWVGTITELGRIKPKEYTVSFPQYPKYVINYPSYRLRVHQEWRDARWVQSPSPILDNFNLD